MRQPTVEGMLFLSDENLTEIAFATIQSPENKNSFFDQLALNHCLGTAEVLVLTNFQPYFYSVLETNSPTNQPSAGHSGEFVFYSLQYHFYKK